MFKRIILDNQLHSVDVDSLTADLSADGLQFVELSLDGELKIQDGDKIELWLARPEGCGASNTHWGNLPGGYEFCSGRG